MCQGPASATERCDTYAQRLRCGPSRCGTGPVCRPSIAARLARTLWSRVRARGCRHPWAASPLNSVILRDSSIRHSQKLQQLSAAMMTMQAAGLQCTSEFADRRADTWQLIRSSDLAIHAAKEGTSLLAVIDSMRAAFRRFFAEISKGFQATCDGVSGSVGPGGAVVAVARRLVAITRRSRPLPSRRRTSTQAVCREIVLFARNEQRFRS